VRALLATLEHTIEQHARVAELEQERFATLEATLVCRAERAEAIQGQLQDRLANNEALCHTKGRKTLVLQENNEQVAELRQQLSAERAQVIEKTCEIIKLQEQLKDEMTKRQTVQYQVIEKERMIMDLQRQLLQTGKNNGFDNKKPHERQPVPTQMPRYIKPCTVVRKLNHMVVVAQAPPMVPTFSRVSLSPPHLGTTRSCNLLNRQPFNTRYTMPPRLPSSQNQDLQQQLR